MEVLDERVNPLLGRREAKLVVRHEGAGTPDRITVRNLAANHFKAPANRVFVKSISTRTGGSSALCVVEVYDEASQAEKIVPAYLKNRNLPKDQRVSKKKGEEAKPAPAPVAKPAEKKVPETKPAPKPAPAKDTKETKAPPKPEAAKDQKPPEAKPAKGPAKADAKPKG